METPLPPGARDYSISLVRANLYGAALIPPVALALVALFAAVVGPGRAQAALVEAASSAGASLLAVAAGAAAHEGLHALGWKLASGCPWRAFRFGIHWKALAPYAHCTRPMTARAYRIGSALPGLALGLAPAAAGLLLPSGGWFLFGLVFTVSAAGDALVLWIIRRAPPGAVVADHPTRVGCLVAPVEGSGPPTGI